jgi:hypothetical protein
MAIFNGYVKLPEGTYKSRIIDHNGNINGEKPIRLWNSLRVEPTKIGLINIINATSQDAV